MKTNVCKIALMFLIGTALSLLFNSCSKDPKTKYLSPIMSYYYNYSLILM